MSSPASQAISSINKSGISFAIKKTCGVIHDSLLSRPEITSMSGAARVLAMSGYVWVNVLPDDGNAGLPRLGQ